MMKPWRYPATANAAASAINTRSSRSPDTASTVSGLRGRRNVLAHSVPRVRQAGQGRAGRELSYVRPVPGLFPPAEREQAVDHERGEPPYEHLARQKGRPRLAGGIPDHQP